VLKDVDQALRLTKKLKKKAEVEVSEKYAETVWKDLEEE